MYRVELKVVLHAFPHSYKHIQFLMYRVELKGQKEFLKKQGVFQVPNVPCGVERILFASNLLKD